MKFCLFLRVEKREDKEARQREETQPWQKIRAKSSLLILINALNTLLENIITSKKNPQLSNNIKGISYFQEACCVFFIGHSMCLATLA